MNRSGDRLDQVAAELFRDYSRARLKGWVVSGALTVNGLSAKASSKVIGGELIELKAQLQEDGQWLPEAIDLDIVFEDPDILVINKPAGLVVHPAAGNWSGTLLNGLLHHDPELATVPRAGIVHRLDKDTSGLMVVAKNVIAQHVLVQQLQARTVGRKYYALVHGAVLEAGQVDLGIGRHRSQRTKMACEGEGAVQVKEALTYYEPVENIDEFTLLSVKLATGRTHQIRVHMSHLGFPLVGDPVYGKRVAPKKLKANPGLIALDQFPRQALHATELRLCHPQTGLANQWQRDLPEDMACLLDHLRRCTA